jgi:mRNA interferase MazF
MVKEYIPKKGDIINLDFSPTKGHEQSGVTPAIVISNNVFNKNTKMVIVCPITSNEKEFPTHYLLEDTKKIHGSVLCEHIKSIDYESRKIRFVEKASDNDIMSVIMLMNACIEE